MTMATVIATAFQAAGDRRCSREPKFHGASSAEVSPRPAIGFSSFTASAQAVQAKAAAIGRAAAKTSTATSRRLQRDGSQMRRPIA